MTNPRPLRSCDLVSFPAPVIARCALVGAAIFLGQGAARATTIHDLADLSIEELMAESVTVTSVSKREQKLSDTASAVTVLSNQDIRRSGVTTVADALRLVPGMNVGSANASEWSISTRGSNSLYANKLLVVVDGRAVYSPMFSGVYWDIEQTLLDDVDRIEVIRGPGATVWGANAVNGVVNVVTRSAKDTQGGLVYGAAGDVEDLGGGMRFGGQLAENTYYRVFATHLTHGDHVLANGKDAGDGWQAQHGGFRMDHYPDPDTQLTWLTGATTVRTDDTLTDARNANTLARFQKRLATDTTFEVQAYYDQRVREEVQRVNSRIDTVDLTAQHTFPMGERIDVIWGLGYRHMEATLEQTSPVLEVRDGEVRSQLFSAFVQNEFKVIPDQVVFTAGVKIEHNDYTGVEIQPSVRGIYKPTRRQTLWAAVSRAVRTPGGVEGDDILAVAISPPIVGPDGGLYVPRIVGNPETRSEVLWAYELGYRIQASRRVHADLALFYNDYSDLISMGTTREFIPGTPVGSMDIPGANAFGGQTYGGEVSVTVAPTPFWKLTASYSLLIADIIDPANPQPDSIERGSPRNQAALRSSHDFGRWSVDATVRYVDAILFVPSYITADLRLAYRPNDQFEFALVGQNLLQDQHREQGPPLLSSNSEVPRGFYGKITWRF